MYLVMAIKPKAKECGCRAVVGSVCCTYNLKINVDIVQFFKICCNVSFEEN
jgi:hypothetical protein